MKLLMVVIGLFAAAATLNVAMLPGAPFQIKAAAGWFTFFAAYAFAEWLRGDGKTPRSVFWRSRRKSPGAISEGDQ